MLAAGDTQRHRWLWGYKYISLDWYLARWLSTPLAPFCMTDMLRWPTYGIVLEINVVLFSVRIFVLIIAYERNITKMCPVFSHSVVFFSLDWYTAACLCWLSSHVLLFPLSLRLPFPPTCIIFFLLHLFIVFLFSFLLHFTIRQFILHTPTSALMCPG